GLEVGIHAAVFIAQSLECLLEHRDAVVFCKNFNRPEDTRFPPMLHISCRPGDTIIVDAGRARYLMVVRSQSREAFGGNHARRSPCLVPHSIQACAMS